MTFHIHLHGWKIPRLKIRDDATWEPGKHPRGQPGNPGQFGSGGGGESGGGGKTVKAEHIAKGLGLHPKLFRAALRKLGIAKEGSGYAWSPQEAAEITKKVAAFKKIVLSSDLPPKEAAAAAVAEIAKEPEPKAEPKPEPKAEPKVEAKKEEPKVEPKEELAKEQKSKKMKADPAIVEARKKAIKEEISNAEEDSYKKRNAIAATRPKPTPGQETSTSYYKLSGYKDINNGLRSPPPKAWVEGDIKNIKSYLDGASLPEDMTLWRGVKSAYARQLLKQAVVGATIEDAGFVSGSTSGEFAAEWVKWGEGATPGVLVKVDVKKGAKGATPTPEHYSDREREIMLQAGGKYRVLAVDLENRFIHLEHYD